MHLEKNRTYVCTFPVQRKEINVVKGRFTMRYSSRKLTNEKVIITACNFWRQIACSSQVMSGNVLLLGQKNIWFPPFFQNPARGVHACSLRFSALKSRRATGKERTLGTTLTFWPLIPQRALCARVKPYGSRERVALNLVLRSHSVWLLWHIWVRDWVASRPNKFSRDLWFQKNATSTRNIICTLWGDFIHSSPSMYSFSLWSIFPVRTHTYYSWVTCDLLNYVSRTHFARLACKQPFFYSILETKFIVVKVKCLENAAFQKGLSIDCQKLKNSFNYWFS